MKSGIVRRRPTALADHGGDAPGMAARFLLDRRVITALALLVAATVTTLSEKLIKIGARVVRHGCYITFQMAEVAVSRALFANILRLIDGLRPPPLPP